jgi:hypothetical protein
MDSGRSGVAWNGDSIASRAQQTWRRCFKRDYYAQKKRWWLRLHEKNGKLNEMPCHHKLESHLDTYNPEYQHAEQR